MAVLQFKQDVTIDVFDCASCGMHFGVPADYIERRREDHRGFYCPAGHSNAFKGETDADRLRKMLNEANARNTKLADEWGKAVVKADKAEAERARLMKRVKAGVCTCCNRTFQNLARHMATKHGDAKK